MCVILSFKTAECLMTPDSEESRGQKIKRWVYRDRITKKTVHLGFDFFI
jgi:hypothetical protein